MTEKRVEQELKEWYAQVPPPPGGVAAGRERMLAQVAEMRAIPARTGRRRQQPRLALGLRLATWLTVILVGIGATGIGVAAASADALPGQTLYPAKLVVEDLRLAVARDPAGRLELIGDYLQERVREMQALVEKNDLVPDEPAERMAELMDSALADLAAIPQDQTVELSARFQEQLQVQVQALEGMGGDQPAVRTALQATHRVMVVHGSPGDPPGPQNQPPGGGDDHTPGPHATATPPQYQEQEQERERHREGTMTPPVTTTVEPPQNQHQQENQNRNQEGTPPRPGGDPEEPPSQGGGNPPPSPGQNHAPAVPPAASPSVTPGAHESQGPGNGSG